MEEDIPAAEEEETSSVAPEERREEGVLEKAGISIYMEGTHRLLKDDGRLLLLESASVDLDTFIGSRVAVTGLVRQTVEAGGEIMDVELVEDVSAEEAPSSEGENESSVQASEETVQEPPSSASSVVPPPPSSTASSAAPEPPSAEIDERSSRMAKDKTESDQWTQQYCSSHIGFCIPVHRNWWFKSFGTTTSFLWHLELGPEELQELGDGPVVLNLMEGSLSAAGASERDLKVNGDFVVGYRSWTDNRHFEITAPAALRDAIQYLTENLAVYETQE